MLHGGDSAPAPARPGHCASPTKESYVSFLNRAGARAPVDVGAVLEPGTIEYLVSIIQSGALVSLGCTRDGGTMSVTVTIDGQYEREWVRTAEEACDFLREVDRFVHERPASPPSKRRTGKGA